MYDFSISNLPRIIFGPGTFTQVAGEVRSFGTRCLIVCGAKSFRDSPNWTTLVQGLKDHHVTWDMVNVPGEPSPEMIDEAVMAHKGAAFDVVLGVGGGSALDAAKAIAGLLHPGNSVMDHLEGVGPERPYCGPATPFIAVPTTAGTGSEATKNAVLSRHGPDGFKKSFRDDGLMARVAIVDPDLLATCPLDVVAANGMDAFTQLLESIVSTRSNPMTDALAWSGLQAFREGFMAWHDAVKLGSNLSEARSKVAYASLMSGICLAQTGLGSVHGLASPLGSFFPMPHGVVCGTLVAEATSINIRALKERLPDSPALAKYARAGSLLAGEKLTGDAGFLSLEETLHKWTAKLELPRLSSFGMTQTDIPRIVANSRGSSMKTNPLVLDDGEISEILSRRL